MVLLPFHVLDLMGQGQGRLIKLQLDISTRSVSSAYFQLGINVPFLYNKETKKQAIVTQSSGLGKKHSSLMIQIGDAHPVTYTTTFQVSKSGIRGTSLPVVNVANA